MSDEFKGLKTGAFDIATEEEFYAMLDELEKPPKEIRELKRLFHAEEFIDSSLLS